MRKGIIRVLYMSIYWSENIKNLKPYLPGEQPKEKKYIKLNTNESPYPPSPRVLEAIKNAANEDLRLYPDPECGVLCETIASYYNLRKQQVFVGNGSDEILAFSFLAFFDNEEPILFPDITYSFYPVYASLFNIDYITIKVNEDFSIPVDGFFQKNGGIIIPNPNAPTGKYLELESVVSIISKNPNRVVVIDEAYIDFGGESAVRFINEYNNLLIIQTFSKSRSLAGLRLGFAIGNEDLIKGLNVVKNSFNSYTVDRLALAGGCEAILDDEYFKETRRRVIKTREEVIFKLKELGFGVIDSKANFIFITHPEINAALLFQKLKDNGVLVRHFNNPGIDNYLRVSIGKEEEMAEFIDNIKDIFSKLKIKHK